MDRNDIIKASNEALDRPRWRVKAWYRTDAGLVDVDHEIMELEDLHDLIERGPNWYGLDHIRIDLNVPDEQKMTIQEAEADLMKRT